MRRCIFLIFLFLSTLSGCFSIPSVEELRSNSSFETSNQVTSNPLKIWIPYVGQGDATLLQLPNGKKFLIDTSYPEAAKQWLTPFLQELGIQNLDALLITHYDYDHFGGVPTLVAGPDETLGTDDDLQIQQSYDRGEVPWDFSPGWNPYLETLDFLGISSIPLQPGASLILDHEVEIRCIAVNGRIYQNDGTVLSLDLTPANYSGQENAASIALLIQYKNFRYLTAGDLTGGANLNGYLSPNVESLLATSIGEVTALHANHHGSLSSSNQNFVEATHPEVVFIQAGQNNPYGHPAPAVLERWQAIGSEIYSTHEGEGFLLTTDGESFEVQTIE